MRTEKEQLEFWKEVIRTNGDSAVPKNTSFNPEKEKKGWVEVAKKKVKELSK